MILDSFYPRSIVKKVWSTVGMRGYRKILSPQFSHQYQSKSTLNTKVNLTFDYVGMTRGDRYSGVFVQACTAGYCYIRCTTIS